jgi:subtilase family serine protease
VNAVAAGRRSIEFSGTASQGEQAFHTEIHRYSDRLSGEEYVANSTDISIPSALAPVVGGVVSLHNFRANPLHKTIAHKPLTALSGGTNALSPYDFAAIYDVAALWNLNFDGTGQTVAVAGRTNIDPTDVTTFRTTFGLPGNNTQVVLNGTDPGIVSSDEETEADLDVEWSGAVAEDFDDYRNRLCERRYGAGE